MAGTGCSKMCLWGIGILWCCSSIAYMSGLEGFLWILSWEIEHYAFIFRGCCICVNTDEEHISKNFQIAEGLLQRIENEAPKICSTQTGPTYLNCYPMHREDETQVTLLYS